MTSAFAPIKVSPSNDDSTFKSEKISAIIITKNEEKNIKACLDSLRFVNEIVLVDSGSTDKTIEIARSFENIKIIQTQWFGFVENKKIALEQTKNNWVLWIDADEIVPEELAKEWLNRNNSASFNQKTGAISIPRKTFFLGHWVKHSGWYPNRVLRFFHKERASFNTNILHEGLVINDGYHVEEFKNDLLHYSYNSLFQYFQKMNSYGYAGAQELERKGKKVFLFHLFISPFWTFLRFYILKQGIKDGLIGIIVCYGAAYSNFIKYTNYLYLKKYGSVQSEGINSP